MKAIGNVSIAPSASFNIVGVRGTSDTLVVSAYPAPGFTVNADNFSITETSDTDGIYEQGDAAGGAYAVQIPGVITFPDEATASVTLKVNGSAQDESLGIQTISATFVNNLTNADINDDSDGEEFKGNYDTTLPYTLNIIPDDGYQFETAPTVTSDDSDVVEVLNVTGTVGGAYVAKCLVKFGDSETDAVTLTVNGTGALEPFVYSLDITTIGFDNILLDTGNNYVTNFSETDANTDSITITALPINGEYEFTSTDDITFDNEDATTITSKTINDGTGTQPAGSYSFDYMWTYPSPRKNQSQKLTLTATNPPTRKEATMGQYGVAVLDLDLAADSSKKTTITANGTTVSVIPDAAAWLSASTDLTTEGSGTITFTSLTEATETRSAVVALKANATDEDNLDTIIVRQVSSAQAVQPDAFTYPLSLTNTSFQTASYQYVDVDGQTRANTFTTNTSSVCSQTVPVSFFNVTVGSKGALCSIPDAGMGTSADTIGGYTVFVTRNTTDPSGDDEDGLYFVDIS